jgi:hypothetical protein
MKTNKKISRTVDGVVYAGRSVFDDLGVTPEETVQLIYEAQKEITQRNAPEKPLGPILWMTPDGEGWRIRWEPPVTDVPLGWTPLYAEPRPAPPRRELMDALAGNESAYQRGYMDGRAVQSTNPLTDNQIEKIRTEIFSTDNPYCPVDRKSMRKVAKAIEAAHDIKEQA